MSLIEPINNADIENIARQTGVSVDSREPKMDLGTHRESRSECLREGVVFDPSNPGIRNYSGDLAARMAERS